MTNTQKTGNGKSLLFLLVSTLMLSACIEIQYPEETLTAEVTESTMLPLDQATATIKLLETTPDPILTQTSQESKTPTLTEPANGLRISLLPKAQRAIQTTGKSYKKGEKSKKKYTAYHKKDRYHQKHKAYKDLYFQHKKNVMPPSTHVSLEVIPLNPEPTIDKSPNSQQNTSQALDVEKTTIFELDNPFSRIQELIASRLSNLFNINNTSNTTEETEIIPNHSDTDLPPRTDDNSQTEEYAQTDTADGDNTSESHSISDNNDTVSDNAENTVQPPTEIESEIETESTPFFSDKHYCSDTIKLMAQSMPLSEFEAACRTLASVATEFHETMQTQYQPVLNDNNEHLEVYIFNSYADYMNNIQQVSGLDYQSNGGFFYEGNPSKVGNTAKIYVFEKTYTAGIWNLDHEYVHRLHARYIKQGPVNDGEYYLFWEEGIAEYFSKGTTKPRLRLSQQDFSIDDVIKINTNSSQTQIYDWSYWLLRFIIEEKTSLFYELADHLKNNQLADYQRTCDFIANSYNDEFKLWLSD